MRCLIQVEYRDSLLRIREEVLQSLGRPIISVLGSRAAMALNLSEIAPGVIIIGHRASRSERQELIEHFRKTSPETPIIALLGHYDVQFENVNFNCPADDPPLWVSMVTQASTGIQ
jgi:hypothetical protein